MIEAFLISAKGSSPGQPWMTPSVTSNSLQCRTKIKPQGQKPSLPVKPHLSIEGDLVSPADEAELLAAHVVGRPRACVWIVGACSVRFAELPFRDVFAAAIILPNIVLQIRKSLHFEFDQKKYLSVPGDSRDKQGFRESKIQVRLSLCTFECGQASGSCN